MRLFQILEMTLGYTNGPLACLKDFFLSPNKRNFKLIRPIRYSEATQEVLSSEEVIIMFYSSIYIFLIELDILEIIEKSPRAYKVLIYLQCNSNCYLGMLLVERQNVL